MAPTIAQEWLKAPDKSDEARNVSGYHWFLQNEGYKLEVMRLKEQFNFQPVIFGVHEDGHLSDGGDGLLVYILHRKSAQVP